MQAYFKALLPVINDFNSTMSVSRPTTSGLKPAAKGLVASSGD